MSVSTPTIRSRILKGGGLWTAMGGCICFNPNDPFEDTESLGALVVALRLHSFNPNDPFEDTESWRTRVTPCCPVLQCFNPNDPFEDTESAQGSALLAHIGGFNPNDPFEDTESSLVQFCTLVNPRFQPQRSVRGY